MNIICWLSSPCYHYTGVFNALAKIWAGKIIIIYENRFDNIHKNLGLEKTNLSNKIDFIFLETITNPQSKVNEIVQTNPNTIHIYYGFQPRNKFFQICIPQIIKTTDSKLVFFSERPRQYTFFMGLARELNYRLNTLKYGSKISAILALGNLGVTAFNRFGFNKTKIFPMAYCVDQPDISYQQLKSDSIHFIYLTGSQEHYCKGLDVIFKAFSSLRNLNWTCDILGFDQTTQLINQIQIMGLESKIHFLGKCTNTEVFEHIQKNDVLLLPSRHDGWGVAIAEGIFCGLGAIASDNVGSKDLIENFQCGQIVKAGDVRSLTDSIKFCIENKNVVEQWKTNAIKHRYRLNASSVADYLKQILEYVFIRNYQGERPIPPWKVHYNNKD